MLFKKVTLLNLVLYFQEILRNEDMIEDMAGKFVHYFLLMFLLTHCQDGGRVKPRQNRKSRGGMVDLNYLDEFKLKKTM